MLLSEISIHALRVEGDPEVGHIVKTIGISIHALRVEGDGCMRFKDLQAKISIHALRVEGDNYPATPFGVPSDFYPRPPGGGRPAPVTAAQTDTLFLSTPSGWRATFSEMAKMYKNYISIHALRVEGDLFQFVFSDELVNFYPRPPGRGRPCNVIDTLNKCAISIHALRVEGDSKNGQSFRLFLRKREKNLPL